MDEEREKAREKERKGKERTIQRVKKTKGRGGKK